MEGRTQSFQQLKPLCVALSQDALALNGPRPNIPAVTSGLDGLKSALCKLVSKPHCLDPKLADYIFFPISQVLKLSQRVPLRCLELCLECIAILINQGWAQQIQTQLAAQIVILCTLMAEKTPKGFVFRESSAELQIAAFSCLQNVFAAAGSSLECVAFFRSEGNFPQLGQTISTILDGISDSGTAKTQITATHALSALVCNVADREICASFLPGIVSKLTKILVPTTKRRRNHQVLVGGLEVLERMLKETLSDDPPVASIESKKLKPSRATDGVISEKWKQNAATQLKPALTSVVRLRTHDRDDVRGALADLCLVLLERCRKSLANCSQLALETLLTLSAGRSDSTSSTSIRLEILLKANPTFATLLQTTVHDWLKSLPTVIQGADELEKVRKVQQISAAYGLLGDSQSVTAMIDKMLASALRDSVTITLQAAGAKDEGKQFVSSVQSLDLAVLDKTKDGTDFGSALVQYRGQAEIMGCIEQFVKTISSSSTSASFSADLARSLRYSHGDIQMANFWLLLTATQNALQRRDDVSDFLDFGDDDDKAIHRDCLEELYAFALSTLTASSDEEPPDPRLQALALRALALRAQTAGRDFRYELIDALYPVLSTLATPSEQLQQDSITTLSIFTNACAYPSVRDLIVDNVDYLTNAVALKLNSFDVSPQAPQVLLMMVRLAGARLVPYLEDTVDSIFAVLEQFHGYPLLVEVLFKVLGVVAEEGAKAPLLAVEGVAKAEVAGMMQERWEPLGVDGLAEMLRERIVGDENQREGSAEEREAAPQRPWITTELDEEAKEVEDEDESLTQFDPRLDDTDPPPPAPKTYNLLFKVTELTQHFLPSASPSLRASLLSLVHTTVPAIARHENSFLPLINTLWPEIIPRLDDSEPHVQALALEIVGVLCESAGDFMRTRITQLWPGLLALYRQTAKGISDSAFATTTDRAKQQRHVGSSALVTIPPAAFQRAVTRMQTFPDSYTDTSTRLVWDALTSVLTAAVKSVPLPPELFEDALEMLGPVLESRPEVKTVLENENADAVWLALVKSGLVAVPQTPAAFVGAGKGRAEWRFPEMLT
ncbi:hypothetical protein B0A50_03154 [Salinomyces thailandicus]|uniref:Uncharacterized protein n=1 Tax=Salinomyces thailandicus TaxID=706561 RepID=A0A4U0U3Y1_9PEZI|nr:hypothetical protein B0A50_03154 [Salinomyces thailandica]